jgi:hypothetical protein
MELEKMDYSDALKSLAEQGGLSREELTKNQTSTSKYNKSDHNSA